MKKLMIIGSLLLTGQSFGQEALGEVLGEVVDKKTGATVYDAVVTIKDNGTKYQARTDFDGRFRISAIPAGTYIMMITQYEDTMKNIIVEVPMDGFFNAGTIEFTSSVMTIDGGTVRASDKIVMIDGNLPVRTLTSEEIDKSPAKFDVKSLISSMSSEIKLTDDGELVFRGARKGDMLYLVDGVKTGTVGNVPGCSIGRMMVYTGGLPAKYGDTLGGVVVMESKSYFDLYRKWEADQIR